MFFLLKIKYYIYFIVHFLKEFVTFLKEFLNTVKSWKPSSQFSMYKTPSVRNGRGRPKLEITCQQMEYLIGLRFSATSIAKLLGVSLSTVRRRMRKSTDLFNLRLLSSIYYQMNIIKCGSIF